MIVVTGGVGFIGSAFVAQLNAEGIHDVVVVDSSGLSHQAQLLANKRYVQFMDKDEFIDLLRKDALPFTASAIVHLGACSRTTERNIEYLRTNNIEYSKSIIEYSIKKNIRCVYASSAATYGDGSCGYSDNESEIHLHKPLNLYGDSKQQCDLWAREHEYTSHVVGLKFFNVYGPNEYYKADMASVVWKAFNTIRDTGSFSLFRSHRPDYKDGEQKRDFVYVKDCCRVMMWFLRNPQANGIFNVGSGKAGSWNDLVNGVFTAMGRKPQIEYIDMPESIRDQYQYFTQAPIEKLICAGYSAPMFSLEEGIKDYITQHLVKEDQHW